MSSKYFLLVFFFLSTLASAKNALANSHQLVDALDQEKIQKDEEKAKTQFSDVIQNGAQNGHTFTELAQSKLRQMSSDEEIIEKTRNYLEGSKTNYFCKNVGLVRMEGKHKNGAWSRVSLLNGERKLDENSYSCMVEGQWNFLLESTYRPEGGVSSTWVESGAKNNYRMREKTPYGENLLYAIFKNGKVISSGYNGTGNVIEPSPMYLPSDYAYLWGEQDAGYLINFQQNAVQEVEGIDNDLTNTFRFKTKGTRKVAQHFDNYSYEAQGKKYEYKDCWKVEYSIVVGKVIDTRKEDESQKESLSPAQE